MENKLTPMQPATPKGKEVGTTPLKANELPAVITPQVKDHAIMVLKSQFKHFATLQGVELTPQEISCGTALIGDLVQRITEEKYDTRKLNLQSFLSDVKDTAKLGLTSKNKEIYFDIRNNGKTGQIDVKVKRQYQGEKSILTHFFEKKIIRFMDGVVCKNDEFAYHKDFATGLTVIDNHIEKDTNRNDVNNFLYAYAIAYVQEGDKVVPTVCLIDSIRIKRAMQAATTKNVWNADSRAMAIKTAYWCLKQMFEPFMTKNIDIATAIANTDDEMNFETTITHEVVDIDNLPTADEQPTAEVKEVANEPADSLDELPNADEPINELVCADCGAVITEKVASFSKSKFSKPLCMTCQKKQ